MVENINVTYYNTFNDNTGKRSHSIIENAESKQEEGISKNYNNNKLVISFNNSINASINNTKNRIPISKVNNSIYNSNTYEGSLKRQVNKK